MDDKWCKCRLVRDQKSVTVSGGSTRIAGSNQNRYALVISSPQVGGEQSLAVNTVSHNNNTTGTGNVINYTCPSGKTAILRSATFFETAAAGVVSSLTLLTGGVTITLGQYTTSGIWSGLIALNAGDKVQWVVTTAQPASTADYGIFVDETVSPGYCTVSFNTPAILDSGIEMYAGGPPLVLLYEHFGHAVREEISAIMSSGSAVMTIVDIFGSQLDDLARLGR